MKKRIWIVLAILIIIGAIVGYFYLTTHNDTKEANNKEKTVAMKYIEKGYLAEFIDEDHFVDNLDGIVLNEGDYINIYLKGNEINSSQEKTPFIINAVVSNKFDSSTKQLGILVPKEMISVLKCTNSITRMDSQFKIIVKKSDDIDAETTFNDELTKIVESNCQSVPAE